MSKALSFLETDGMIRFKKMYFALYTDKFNNTNVFQSLHAQFNIFYLIFAHAS